MGGEEEIQKEKFGKEQRIYYRREISELLRTGKRIRTGDFQIVFKKNTREHDRLAVLVSRKHGNAVQRNQLKRWVREVFRRTSQPPVDRHFDVIIRPVWFSEFNLARARNRYSEWRRSVEKLPDE